ncbi:TolC family outer membrane protein [Acidiferrobacter sp.]|uniref:TolC family outer membrane protein n=1 Tax=Acidiferrobacter sp. TaxID=1872107 RepID=UPI0026168ECF|nr:TolC family outer membrane protein [Acidiferrobacter sp.]
MIMPKRASLAFLSLLFALTAAPAPAANLEDIFQAACLHDMGYRQAGASYREARTLGPKARSAFLPHVSAQANTSYNDLTSTIIGGVGGLVFPSGHFTFNAHGYGVSVTQTLLDIHALYAWQAAGATMQAARLRYALARSNLILTVSAQYFGFLLARDDLRLRRAEERALRAEYESAMHSFHLGRASITDANEAWARYEVVHAQMLTAHNAVRLARARIERMTGLPARHLWPLNLHRSLPRPRTGTLIADEARAQRQSLILQAARSQAHAASESAHAASAARYPTITAEASYSYTRADDGEFGFGTTLSDKTIGVDLNLPIYQGGELSAESERASAAAFRAHVAVLRAQRRIQFDVRQAFLNVRNGYHEVAALAAAKKAARVALASERLGMRVGIRNNVDVLRAEQAYYRSRRDFARAVYDYLLGRLELTAAMSHLKAADIKRLNALLRPPDAVSPAGHGHNKELGPVSRP